MKRINLGLIGFGTIGTGVARLLQESIDLIQNRLGAKLVLKKIADLDITTKRQVTVRKGLLTTDAKAVLDLRQADVEVPEPFGAVSGQIGA